MSEVEDIGEYHSLVIYIKIGSRRVRSRVVVQSGELGLKYIHTILERGRIKMSKDPECSGDDEATQRKARKPVCPLSPQIK